MLCAKNGPELANLLLVAPPFSSFPLVAPHRLSHSRLSFFLSFVSPKFDTRFDPPPTLLHSLFWLLAATFLYNNPLTTPPRDTPFFQGFESLVRSLWKKRPLNDFGLNLLRLSPDFCACRLVRLWPAYRASSCVIEYNYIRFDLPERASSNHASPSRSQSGDEALRGSTGGHSLSPTPSRRAYGHHHAGCGLPRVGGQSTELVRNDWNVRLQQQWKLYKVDK